MTQKVENNKRRQIVKWIIWAVIILALLGTMHVLVNTFDLFDFLQNLHGG